MVNLKGPLFKCFCKQQCLRKKLPTSFSTIGQNKFYLDIGSIFTQKFLLSKNQIFWKSFSGLKFFPDFGSQISQQQFFIIWQDAQRAHQLFFMNVSPNGTTENSKSKNPFIALCQNGNIVVKNL